MAAGGPSVDFESPPIAIQTALSLARRRLGMDVAFVSEVTGDRRIFRYVDSDLDEGPVRVGEFDPLDETYCKLVIDGSMPVSVGDVMNTPELPDLPTRERYGIRAHAGVPLVLSDGTVFGTFCLIAPTPTDGVSDEGVREVEVLAAFVAEQFERDLGNRAAWEDQLQAERSALIQSIAHEVRNPLTVIHGVADLLERLDRPERVEPEVLHELLDSVVVSSRRLADLVERVIRTADAMVEGAGSADVELTVLVVAAARSLGAAERVDVDDVDDGVRVACSGETLDALITAVVEHALLQSVPRSSIRAEGRCDEHLFHLRVAYRSLGVERTGSPAEVQRTSGAGVRLLLANTLARESGGRLDFRLVPDGSATIEVALPLVDD